MQKNSTTNTPRFDMAEIRRSVALLCEAGEVYELRAFGRGTISGYFDDFEKMAQVAAKLSGNAPAVYLTINPVNPDLFARASNCVVNFAKTTMPDTEIVQGLWLPIDFDPKRPTGISSTNAEHDAAIALGSDR